MPDKLKGKYHSIKECRELFKLAKEVLKNEYGKLTWAKNDYQAFIFKNDKCCLVFYYHTVRSTGNKHMRIREQNSKDEKYAYRLMCILDDAAGYNCTFTHKAMSHDKWKRVKGWGGAK